MLLFILAALAADPTPPAGTWTVVAGRDVGLVMRFFPTEYAFVSPKDERMDRRALTWSVIPGGFAGSGPVPFTLTQSGDGWHAADGRNTFEFRPATPEEIALFDRVYAATPSPAELCPIARACCEAAMPMLGATCNVKFQFGNLDSSRSCQGGIDGLHVLFERQGLTLPAVCEAPKPAR